MYTIIRYLLILLLTTSCIHRFANEALDFSEPPPVPEKCMTKLEGVTEEQMDARFFLDWKLAEKGCVKNYGPDYCLTKFIRIGPNNYHAICARFREAAK